MNDMYGISFERVIPDDLGFIIRTPYTFRFVTFF